MQYCKKNDKFVNDKFIIDNFIIDYYYYASRYLYIYSK